jgi:hypothetical protein
MKKYNQTSQETRIGQIWYDTWSDNHFIIFALAPDAGGVYGDLAIRWFKPPPYNKKYSSPLVDYVYYQFFRADRCILVQDVPGW